MVSGSESCVTVLGNIDGKGSGSKWCQDLNGDYMVD